MLWLWNYLRGYVLIKVSGFSVERFLNLVSRNNIYIWDITSHGTYMTMKMSVKGFKKIRPYARKSHCRFKILSKYGYPFKAFKYRKRYLFLTGIAVFLFIIYFMSSFIWLVDIEGNSQLTDVEILDTLEKNGIYPGAFKKNIDNKSVEKSLKIQIPEISWINITLDGTRASVRLAEGVKSINIVDNSSPCDIIADKECVITSIITKSGTPLVRKMDVIEKGDVLVSGIVEIPQEDGSFIPSYVPSQAQIRGKVIHNYSFKIPYAYTLKKYTQNQKKVFSVEVFNKNFNFNFIKNDILYEKYDTIENINQLRFNENFPLPFIIRSICYKEYVLEKASRSVDDAKQLAEVLVTNKIINELPLSTDVLDKKITFTEYEDCLKVTAELTTEENIGVCAPINTETEKKEQ